MYIYFFLNFFSQFFPKIFFLNIYTYTHHSPAVGRRNFREPGINSDKRTRYTPKSEIFWILRWCVLSFCTCWAKKVTGKSLFKNVFLVSLLVSDSFACQMIFIARSQILTVSLKSRHNCLSEANQLSLFMVLWICEKLRCIVNFI